MLNISYLLRENEGEFVHLGFIGIWSWHWKSITLTFWSHHNIHQKNRPNFYRPQSINEIIMMQTWHWVYLKKLFSYSIFFKVNLKQVFQISSRMYNNLFNFIRDVNVSKIQSKSVTSLCQWTTSREFMKLCKNSKQTARMIIDRGHGWERKKTYVNLVWSKWLTPYARSWRELARLRCGAIKKWRVIIDLNRCDTWSFLSVSTRISSETSLCELTRIDAFFLIVPVNDSLLSMKALEIFQEMVVVLVWM